MVKKNDMNKVIDKYRPMLKKFGDEVGVAAKKGEENVVKMSKMLKIQIDMMGVSLQKEKLYHDLGKEVAEKIVKGEIDIPGLAKYKNMLKKFKSDGMKMKKDLTKVSRAKAKKTVAPKKKVAAKKKTAKKK